MCSNAPYTMRSAMAFLPESISTFMNFATSTLPNFGSGNTSRFGTSRRRGIGSPSVMSWRVSHHVVAHARQILHATAADQHNRVLLQIMAFAANIRNDLKTVCQSHLRHFAQR